MPGTSTEPAATDEFAAAMEPIVDATRLLVTEYVAGRLGKLRASIEHAISVGPIIEPTLFARSDAATTARVVKLANDYAYDVAQACPALRIDAEATLRERAAQERIDLLAHDDDARVAQALDEADVEPGEDVVVLRTHGGGPVRVLVPDRGTVRFFHLQRDADPSGVSGTGVVAYGVQWPDGSCVLRWDTAVRSTVLYDSVEDVERITGHDGATRVVWSG